MSKKITNLFLILILFLAFGLRVYKIDEVPKSITWDEAAVGYNAFTIANYGKDEYGKRLPLFFKSFRDDKHPVHVYITAISVKLLGLNEFSIRIPSAIFGTLNVLLIFLLGSILFKNKAIGLLAGFLLAISPYNIHFSRFNHEANFVLFFFMLGLWLFFLSLEKNKKLLPFAVLSFCISFITYHPAKIITPIIIIVLISLYVKRIKWGKNLYAITIVVFFLITLALNPQLFGFARINQTAQSKNEIEKTTLYQKTQSTILGRLELIINQYSWHFSPQYLFIQGDKNPRLSSQTGEFYKIDAIFLILGLIYLVTKRSRQGAILLIWALVAPLPSALVAEAPHAARAVFMMGSWNLISALGLCALVNFFRNKMIKWVIVMMSLVIFLISLSSYLNNYYNAFANRYSIDWQYGMKQIVEYVKHHPEYTEVFMTNIRSQPYIFFLYYLKTPLPEYLNTVYFNNAESKGYNNVSFFDRYYFEGWDPIESSPNKGVLYIVSPSQYDGLRYKQLFDVKEKILYPKGFDAFYIISAK